MTRFLRDLLRPGRRPARRTAPPVVEPLEGRDLPAASLLAGAARNLTPVGKGEVAILFPVFTPAEEAALGARGNPSGILFPVFTPAGYTNPCFRPIDRVVPIGSR